MTHFQEGEDNHTLAVFTWVASQLCEHKTGLHVSSSIYCKPLMGLSFHTLTLVPAERCTACIVKYVVLNRKTLPLTLKVANHWRNLLGKYHDTLAWLLSRLTAYSPHLQLPASCRILRAQKLWVPLGFKIQLCKCFPLYHVINCYKHWKASTDETFLFNCLKRHGPTEIKSEAGRRSHAYWNLVRCKSHKATQSVDAPFSLIKPNPRSSQRHSSQETQNQVIEF